MSKPDHIPQDIWDSANAVYHADVDAPGDWARVVAEAILSEREKAAAFAFAKHDWPPRWIAASLRGENSAYADFRPSEEKKDV